MQNPVAAKYLENSTLLRSYLGGEQRRLRSLSVNNLSSLMRRRGPGLLNELELNLPATENKLQAFLKNAPESVRSFFKVIQFLNTSYLTTQQLKVVQSRFYEYLKSNPFDGYYQESIKTKMDVLIKGMSATTPKMREKILDFFMICFLDLKDPKKLFFLTKLLHMWPYQRNLEDKINEYGLEGRFNYYESEELKEEPSFNDETLYLSVLLSKVQNNNLKERAISCLKRHVKKKLDISFISSQTVCDESIASK